MKAAEARGKCASLTGEFRRSLDRAIMRLFHKSRKTHHPSRPLPTKAAVPIWWPNSAPAPYLTFSGLARDLWHVAGDAFDDALVAAARLDDGLITGVLSSF